MNKYNNVKNNKKNKNTNNVDNDDNVRFLMIKTMIIVIIEELVTIAIGTVIMITFRRKSIEGEKRKRKIKKLN